MKTALENYAAMGSGAGLSYCAYMLAEEFINLGRYEESIQQLESGRAFSRKTGEKFFDPEYFRLHGRIKLENYRDTGNTKQLEKAATYFKEALSRARRLESRALELRAAPYRAQALNGLGNQEHAIRMITQIIERAEAFKQTRDWKFAKETLDGLVKIRR